MENVYTERKILVGTFLGGPLAGGYYFYKNYRAVDEPAHAKLALVITILFTVLLFGALILIPALERLPNMVLPIAYGWTAYAVFRFSLSEKVKTQIEAGAKPFGWANTIVVSLIFLLIMVIPIVGIGFLFPSLFDNGSTRYYGDLKHEIYYDAGNIGEIEVDHVASVLTKSGFFDNEVKKTVDLRQTTDRYILTIYCVEEVRGDLSAIQFFKGFQKEIQNSFLDKRIVLDLVVGTPDNLIQRIE